MNIFDKVLDDLFGFLSKSFLQWALFPIIPWLLSISVSSLILFQFKIEKGGDLYDLVLGAVVVLNIILTLNWWIYPIILRKEFK